MKNKLQYCNIRFVFQTKCKINNSFTFKDKIQSFLRSSVDTNFSVVAAMLPISVVAAMLPIMAKLSVILRLECVKTWKFLHSLGKILKVMMILPLKGILYSAIMHLTLKVSQFAESCGFGHIF